MAHEIYALIYNGVVANVVVGNYSDCDSVAKETYGDNAFAVEVTYIPVQSGDTYHDGIFERQIDGETATIQPVLSDGQKIAQIESENADIRAELDAVSLALLDLIGMGDIE